MSVPYFSRLIRRRRHRGVATLEFVMSLPILVWLMMMIVLVARRHLDQSHMHQNVRHVAWGDKSKDKTLVGFGSYKDRGDMEKPQGAQHMFAFLGNELSGMAAYKEGKILKLYKWMGGNRLSEARAVVLGGTWDQQQMTQINGTSPHLGVLTKMASGGVENLSGSGLISGIASLLRL